MLNRGLRETFKKFGQWQEPFSNYAFYGKLTTKIVHETLFLKDYEIVNSYYVFGKNVKNQEEAEEVFSKFLKESQNFLEVPPDHYLSCMALILTSNQEIDVSRFFKKEFIWLGIKGKVVKFAVYLSSDGLKIPLKAEKEAPEFVKFLKKTLFSTTSRG